MARYLDIFFRSKVRLAVLVLMLPLIVTAVDYYLWRSYDVSEVIWVDDPSTFGRDAGNLLGFNPYLTPAQNATLLFSNLLGTDGFNNAIADKLAAQGDIQTDAERAALIASLRQLSAVPGGSVSGGSGAGGSGSLAPNKIMTIRYVCPHETQCKSVLSVVLPAFRDQYSALKTQTIATARSIYQSQLTAAQAELAAAVAASQQYEAQKPVQKSGTQNKEDPVQAKLDHDVSAAEVKVDTAKQQLQNVETASQIVTAFSNNMSVIDGPTTKPGLLGLRGFRSDNLKVDAIAVVACVAAALAYLILVAFLDRTVRDPKEIQGRTGKPVVAIPDYSAHGKRRPWSRQKRAA